MPLLLWRHDVRARTHAAVIAGDGRGPSTQATAFQASKYSSSFQCFDNALLCINEPCKVYEVAALLQGLNASLADWLVESETPVGLAVSGTPRFEHTRKTVPDCFGTLVGNHSGCASAIL